MITIYTSYIMYYNQFTKKRNEAVGALNNFNILVGGEAGQGLVSISSVLVYCCEWGVDLLVALDQASLAEHRQELNAGSVVTDPAANSWRRHSGVKKRPFGETASSQSASQSGSGSIQVA
ncbi:MAG: hypothetical protein GX228_09485 [Firmicutes bacterium]|jgi:Pyruvate/2-oxoacid:ferredoxin oxidoreductase gamma subunit|nr:hypothetical protein [Bacillota bacterium]NLL89129.1 hypothetical protein [Bacillota bacterium]HKM18311.1 hypothetical protein [Limnochordia bacterium]